MSEGMMIRDPSEALRFMFAGNAMFTLQGASKHFTYRVKRTERGDAFFVKCMTSGQEFEYLGVAKASGDGMPRSVRCTKASVWAAQNARVLAFNWALRRLLAASGDPTVDLCGLEIWHEGHCAACMKPLTDPKSIAAGFGPTCRKRLGL